MNGPLILGSNAQINTVAGRLTLNGPLVSGCLLTKTGVGTLVLNCNNSGSLTGPLIVAGGVLRLQSSGDLGAGGNFASVTVQNGSTVQLQGGINIPNVPMTLNGGGATITAPWKTFKARIPSPDPSPSPRIARWVLTAAAIC